ncbi:MAG: iron ABC transporter permease [Pelistega sp.]|nr:iron ABC transporter permease [Pelistega sp.]
MVGSADMSLGQWWRLLIAPLGLWTEASSIDVGSMTSINPKVSVSSNTSIGSPLDAAVSSINPQMLTVLWDIRLPRIVFAALIGAGLSLAGAVMQALFRNPLAEPGLMGVSAGASLGAVSAIVFISMSPWMIYPFAFAGALAAMFMAYQIGRRYPGTAGLLLAGIAINALAAALLGGLSYLATDAQLRNLSFWTMGSLAVSSWSILAVLVPWVLLLSVYLMRQWKILNALLLGEGVLVQLGYSMRSIRWRLLLCIALLIGPLVALSGGIAFVGLVVPHCVRLLIGAHHRLLLPISMLLGALVLVVLDVLARTVATPIELPIGLLTGLIGSLFFIYLLWRSQQLSRVSL